MRLSVDTNATSLDCMFLHILGSRPIRSAVFNPGETFDSFACGFGPDKTGPYNPPQARKKPKRPIHERKTMELETSPGSPPLRTPVHTLGVVSYLNARPLNEFLQKRCDMRLKPAVPADLAQMLAEKHCDVALLPVVDYWRHRDRLQLVSDACIASDGETLTVRVFSKRPADKIQRLHIDGDSHTSIILAQIIWRELYDCELELSPWDSSDHGSLDDVEALLLIGDKVIRQRPLGFGFEVDLGAAWKYLTGLPCVFAAWYGPRDEDFSELAKALTEARDQGQAEARRIASEAAGQHGWPEETAIRYLCETLKYRLDDSMRAGMDRFFKFAVDHGLLR